MVGDERFVLQRLRLASVTRSLRFASVRCRFLAHRGTSPVVKNISTGDIFRLRLPPLGSVVRTFLTSYIKTKRRDKTRLFVSNWWAMRGSNSRPSRCKRDALPAELIAHITNTALYTHLYFINQVFFLKFYIFFIFLCFFKVLH